MIYFKKVLNVTTLFTALSLNLFSQPKSNKDSLISFKIGELKAVWSLDNDISREERTFEKFTSIPKIYKITAKESVSDDEYVKQVNEARIKLLKQNIGLDAVGNYLQNFNPGFNTDDNLLYHFRYQVGLDWNVLSDGFLENRYKAKIFKNENDILDLTPSTKKNDGENYIAVSHRIIYSFNIHKIKVLDQRQQIIDDKISVANELYLLILKSVLAQVQSGLSNVFEI